MSLQICKIYFLLGKKQDNYYEEYWLPNCFGHHRLPLYEQKQNTKTFLKLFSVLFDRRKKVMQVWNNLRVVKDDRINIFRVKYSLNAHLKPINLMALFMQM